MIAPCLRIRTPWRDDECVVRPKCDSGDIGIRKEKYKSIA
jgi:hypothetical protein